MAVEEFGSSIRCYGLPLLAAVEHEAKARGAVNAHERVGIVPMTARTVAPIDHHAVSITFSDERVGKRHAGSPGSDDKIVSLDHAQDHVSFLLFRLR